MTQRSLIENPCARSLVTMEACHLGAGNAWRTKKRRTRECQIEYPWLLHATSCTFRKNALEAILAGRFVHRGQFRAPVKMAPTGPSKRVPDHPEARIEEALK